MFIQNHPLEGPGTLRAMFEADGLDSTIYRAWERVPQYSDGPVVILGGPQCANDDLWYLRAQEDLIRKCFRNDVPVLGVCLGAQLGARALGGRVYRGPESESGFRTDVVPDHDSGLFADAQDPYLVFHWHQDTFELPPGAVRLASSSLYENQAFAYGSVVGAQFHLEVDAALAGAWAPRMGLEGTFRLDDFADLRRNMELLYNNFKAEYGI